MTDYTVYDCNEHILGRQEFFWLYLDLPHSDLSIDVSNINRSKENISNDNKQIYGTNTLSELFEVVIMVRKSIRFSSLSSLHY